MGIEINKLAKQNHVLALKKGFWDDEKLKVSYPDGMHVFQKTVFIDQETGECPECDREVNEAQAVLGRLGLPQGDSNENKV